MFKRHKGLYTDEYFEDNNLSVDENNEEEVETYEEENKKIASSRKTMNIFFGIVMVLIVLITIDIVFTIKLSIGPFLAIRTKVYKDGGTKEYYGLGYKVIKYNQKQGRRDTVVGSWSMKYNGEATTIELVDLAIEFQTDAEKTYSKLANQFIRTTGTVTKIDKKTNAVILEYTDKDEKYTLKVNCILNKDAKKISTFKKDDVVTVIGTISKYEVKTNKTPNTLSIKDCFISK